MTDWMHIMPYLMQKNLKRCIIWLYHNLSEYLIFHAHLYINVVRSFVISGIIWSQLIFNISCPFIYLCSKKLCNYYDNDQQLCIITKITWQGSIFTIMAHWLHIMIYLMQNKSQTEHQLMISQIELLLFFLHCCLYSDIRKAKWKVIED